MPIQRHTMAWMQRVTAALIATFWTAFWFQRADLQPGVRDYEVNFIVPDLIWIAGLLLVASRLLMTGDRRAMVVSAAAGGALVFLGALDAMFNLRHGQYAASFDGALNVAVNAGCIAFGLWSLYVSADQARR